VFAPAQLIGHPPVRQAQKPGLEGAFGGVVDEALHFSCRRDDGLLHHVLRLGIGESGLQGHAVDQVAIGDEKLIPAFLVTDVPETDQQRLPRRKEIRSGLTHGHPIAVGAGRPFGAAI
jgi:hypothetical protein